MHLSKFLISKIKKFDAIRQRHNFSNSINKNNLFSTTKFSDLEYLREDIKIRLTELKMTYLTKIQEKSLPEIFEKVQNFVLAETGSGKTLLYILPILNNLFDEIQNGERKINEPRGALIFTSSKELGAQIFVDIKQIDIFNKLNIARLGSISQMATYVKHMVY